MEVRTILQALLLTALGSWLVLLPAALFHMPTWLIVWLLTILFVLIYRSFKKYRDREGHD